MYMIWKQLIWEESAKHSIYTYDVEAGPSEQGRLSSDVLSNVHDFLQKQIIQNRENHIHYLQPILSSASIHMLLYLFHYKLLASSLVVMYICI